MNNLPPKRKKATSVTSSNPKAAVNLDNPASATIDVTAVEVPELTPEEQSDRLHLERKVERAFFEAGKALAELRDRRLHRSTHKTFEEYCKDGQVRPMTKLEPQEQQEVWLTAVELAGGKVPTGRIVKDVVQPATG